MTSLLEPSRFHGIIRKEWRDPILAKRTVSWDPIAANRTQSLPSAGGESIVSLVYSSDTEFIDMMETCHIQKPASVLDKSQCGQSDLSTHMVYSADKEERDTMEESRADDQVSPRTKNIDSVEVVKDDCTETPVVVTGQLVTDPSIATPPKSMCHSKSQLAWVPPNTVKNVRKCPKLFVTFITTRTDKAVGPLDDKIEVFIVDVKHLQNPFPEASVVEESSPIPSFGETQSANVESLKDPEAGIFSELVRTLLNDEMIPVVRAAETWSSVEQTSFSTQDSGGNDVGDDTSLAQNLGLDFSWQQQRSTFPSYSQLMQSLLGDEALPELVEPGIPLSIEISHVTRI